MCNSVEIEITGHVKPFSKKIKEKEVLPLSLWGTYPKGIPRE